MYFVRAEKTALGLPLPSSVEGPNGDSMFMNGLNANAPEFTPSSRSGIRVKGRAYGDVGLVRRVPHRIVEVLIGGHLLMINILLE